MLCYRHVASFFKVGEGQTHQKSIDELKKKKQRKIYKKKRVKILIRGGGYNFIILLFIFLYTFKFFTGIQKSEGGGKSLIIFL